MRIGGLQHFTLTDFPKKIAAILFTIGCNFRCPFCYNYKLFDEKHPAIPEKEIFDFLESRQNQLDGIVISGGEPTIHDDLDVFIKKLKNFGYAIKLDTNGSNPDILKKLIEQNLLDYIAMDIKAPFEIYEKLTGVTTFIEHIKQSIQLIIESKIAHEFRTTWEKNLITKEDIQTIKSYLPKSSTYKIQEAIEV